MPDLDPEQIEQPTQPDQMPAESPGVQSPLAPAPANNDVVVQPQPQTAAVLKDSRIKEYGDHADATTADLASGQIKPETYQSLFAKKDTLGKIGTLFGMLVGGAGAGLTGGQNAILEMMNKQIANDLDAQKTSASNAQNLLRINQQNEANKATVGLTHQQTQLTEQQQKLAKADTDLKQWTKTRLDANNIALQHMVQIANKYPPGSPEWQKAQQALALVSQHVQNENFNIADRASTLAATFNAFQQQPGGNPENQFQQQQTALQVSGNPELMRYREDRHVPGIEGMSSVPLSPTDREQINNGNTFQNQLDRFIKWSNQNSGSLNPAKRKEGEALAALLQGAYRQAPHGEGDTALSDIIDLTPTKFFNYIRTTPKLNALKHESSAAFDQLLKSKGFKGYQGVPAENKSASVQPPMQQAGLERKTADGRVALFDPKTKKFLGYKPDQAFAGK